MLKSECNRTLTSRTGEIHAPLAPLRRWLFFGLVASTALIGIGMMLNIMWGNGITGLEVVILALFAVTFCWIAIPFWNAVIGFVLSVLRRDPLSLGRAETAGYGDGPIASRTALVMPVRNEDPSRVTSGLAAMLHSLARTGHGDQFDLFLLSDTTDASIGRAEEAAWTTLREQASHPTALHYRRRPANVGRKAGNIADFCRRWGADYDFMVVLDADSIMTGSAVTELVRAMEASPSVGLIQTVPIPARRTTLFGRLMQFAGCLYSPMLAKGQSFWQTDTANYWGHNAILRVRPFMDHCSLPVLPGHPPFGGDILSHDFVEAALMRRAGWQVYLLPLIDGSYEEAPDNIVEYAKRDRRWTQGSLQHLRLLTTRGFTLVNRLHFLLGAVGYLSSVVWLLMLLASTAYVLVPSLSTTALIPVPWRETSSVIPLLAVTVVLLFVPKLLALVLALVCQRQQYGGALRLLLSVLLETLFAIVVAPLMMMYHTRFVMSVLSGHDIRWSAQVREGRVVGWREVWGNVAGVTTVGLTWAGLTLYYSPTFFMWLTPIFTGLLLAAPLVRWTSSRSLGERSRRRGLFLVPSETTRPPELQVSPWLIEGLPLRESALSAVPPPGSQPDDVTSILFESPRSSCTAGPAPRSS